MEKEFNPQRTASPVETDRGDRRAQQFRYRNHQGAAQPNRRFDGKVVRAAQAEKTRRANKPNALRAVSPDGRKRSQGAGQSTGGADGEFLSFRVDLPWLLASSLFEPPANDQRQLRSVCRSA